MRAFLFAALLVAFSSASQPQCSLGTTHQKSLYPPDVTIPLATGDSRAVPWFNVSLDEDPLTRWSHVVSAQKDEIGALTEVVIGSLRKLVGSKLVDEVLDKVEARLDLYCSAMPSDFGDEIKGIAASTGIRPGVIMVYNLFYSVFGACTSIVAEGVDGEQFAARNLDFGLWPAFNVSHGNIWELTSKLRPVVINVNMQRNGSTLFKATTFNGFIGVHTAVRPGVLSVTIDSRFDSGLDRGLLEWLLLPRLDRAVEVTMATRHMIQTATSYASALSAINTTRVLGPSYIILGGVNPGDGAVITKGTTGGLTHPEGETIAFTSLASRIRNGSHFLVQTNYDGDADGSQPAPKFDDRRDPATKCMQQLGPKGTDFGSLYNTLSTTPNLNRLTAYTTLMHITTGELETYRQLCQGLDCPLF